jgi:hypothetical protein
VSPDPRLEVLPRFEVRSISAATENSLVTGSFSEVKDIAVDKRGWLFVSEDESSIADVVTLDGNVAGLCVPNWAMTAHVHRGATLPWLDGLWQAADLAFLLDRTKEWQRVEYRATDAVVFTQVTLRCAKCGLVADPATWESSACAKCSGPLAKTEVSGWQEASFALESNQRFVEIRSGHWDHDPCLICNVNLGRDSPWGYRESSFAGGPNSVGLWLCEKCFERYLEPDDFGFLVGS